MKVAYDILLTAIPFVIASAAMLMWRRLAAEEIAKRYAAAWSAAAAFFVGYALLPSWAELAPRRHWHWLPHLAVLGAVLGPIAASNGLARFERLLLPALLCVVSSIALVPTWESLEPSRAFYIPALSGYLFLLIVVHEPLNRRVSSRILFASLSLTSVVVAAGVMAFVSIRYGRVAGVAAATVLGCGAASFRQGDKGGSSGFIPLYSVLVGGAAFIGYIEPQPPLIGLLLLPLAPLGLWTVSGSTVERLRTPWRATVQMTAVIAALLIAVAACFFTRG